MDFYYKKKKPAASHFYVARPHYYWTCKCLGIESMIRHVQLLSHLGRKVAGRSVLDADKRIVAVDAAGTHLIHILYLVLTPNLYGPLRENFKTREKSEQLKQMNVNTEARTRDSRNSRLTGSIRRSAVGLEEVAFKKKGLFISDLAFKGTALVQRTARKRSVSHLAWHVGMTFGCGVRAINVYGEGSRRPTMNSALE